MNTAEIIPMHSSPDERQIPNAAWPFQLDHVNHWAYWEKAFTDEECQKIIAIGNNKVHQKGTTKGASRQSIRNSQVAWLYASDDLIWAFRRMTDIVMALNDKFFQFDLFGAAEGFQFTKYEAPGGKYGRHIDCGTNMLVRKLSFTLQLSNPDDYDGGDLCLFTDEEPTKMRRERGYVVLFPSFMLHEVTPVTRGTRYSLVSWLTGKPFK